MTDVDPEQLKAAVERQYGGTAALVDSVPVKETYDGKTVWEGVVHTFDLGGVQRVERVYAWSSPMEGSEKRRLFTIQHTPGITSSLLAVRAAIAAEYRASQSGKK